MIYLIFLEDEEEEEEEEEDSDLLLMDGELVPVTILSTSTKTKITTFRKEADGKKSIVGDNQASCSQFQEKQDLVA